MEFYWNSFFLNFDIFFYVEGRKRNLEALQNAKANKYAVYGPKMQSLVAKIQANAHRFKQQPRGPMGSHFTVKVFRIILVY